MDIIKPQVTIYIWIGSKVTTLQQRGKYSWTVKPNIHTCSKQAYLTVKIMVFGNILSLTINNDSENSFLTSWSSFPQNTNAVLHVLQYNIVQWRGKCSWTVKADINPHISEFWKWTRPSSSMGKSTINFRDIWTKIVEVDRQKHRTWPA